MRTSAVERQTVIGTCGLPVRMIDVHNHRILQRVPIGDGRSVLAVEFIGSHDGLVIPVGPVDPVFEDADRERMSHRIAGRQHGPPTGSVHIAAGYRVEFGVDPKQSLVHIVERDAVGPFNVRIDQNLTLRTVHSGAFYLRRGSPIRPIHPAVQRKFISQQFI